MQAEKITIVIAFVLFIICIFFVCFAMVLIGYEKIKEFWDGLKK